MTTIAPLAEVQRRFCDWLVEADEDRGAAIVAPLGLGPGLVVYQNNYRVALVDALREIHPRAAAWLGDDAFATAAARFIDADPPSHWTIDAYGTRFPESLLPDAMAADLATIDRATGEAFVAADAAPADASVLGDVDWETAVIGLVPSLTLVPLATNADALWLAIAKEEDWPAAEDAPGTLLLWRQGFEPVMRRADPFELIMLQRSLAGISFAAICEELAAQGDEAEAVTRAGTVLGRWLGEGLIAGFTC